MVEEIHINNLIKKMKIREILNKYIIEKINQCKKNGMIPIGRYYEISNNQLFSIMDDLEQFTKGEDHE